jgi:hypothetical protein
MSAGSLRLPLLPLFFRSEIQLIVSCTQFTAVQIGAAILGEGPCMADQAA